MRLLKQICLTLGLAAFLAAPALAADAAKYGTKDEAKALAEKAAALVKENPTAAFAKFQDKEGGFIDRDLYVFALDAKGIFMAHGAKPVLVGKGGLEMKDVTGFAFLQAFMAVKDNGWVDYKWPDPADGGKIKDKSTYIQKVGEYTLGVGYYK